MEEKGSARPDGIATVIIKKSPFTAIETENIFNACENLGFDVVMSPISAEPPFSMLETVEMSAELERTFPLDVSLPTDNRPFFFLMLRFKDLFRAVVSPEEFGQGIMNANLRAVQILGGLLALIAILCAVFIFAPLLWQMKGSSGVVEGSKKFIAYFACLGLGFMLVEIPLVQSYILFLGHPLSSLSVVLFVLLTAGGVGSLITRKFTENRSRKSIRTALVLVLIILPVLLIISIGPVNRFNNMMLMASKPIRIIVAAACLSPLGILMGMPFPLGISLIEEKKKKIVPWVWAINGSMSVMGSVMALSVSVYIGFASTLHIGQLLYLCALAIALTFSVRES